MPDPQGHLPIDNGDRTRRYRRLIRCEIGVTRPPPEQPMVRTGRGDDTVATPLAAKESLSAGRDRSDGSGTKRDSACKLAFLESHLLPKTNSDRATALGLGAVLISDVAPASSRH